MFEPGDMVYNKIENEIQLVIEIDPACHAHLLEALLLAPDGEMLWYPFGFLADPSKRVDEDEA